MNVTPAFKKSALDKELTLGTLKMMFLNASHVENLSTQIFISDVNANQLTAGGDYVAGGITLTTVSSAIVGTGVVLDFADFSVTGIDTATQGAISSLVVYVDTGTATTSRIISQQTLASDVTLVATDTYSIAVSASGLIKID